MHALAKIGLDFRSSFIIIKSYLWFCFTILHDLDTCIRLQKCHFHTIKKFAFFQSLVKNAKFLSSLFFFEKGLNMYFYDVVYRKGSFLDYKNVIFT